MATEVLPLVPVTATKVLGWRAVEGGGGQGVGAARVGDLDHRGREALDDGLAGQHRRRAAGQGVAG